jgi:hypothetical protein
MHIEVHSSGGKIRCGILCRSLLSHLLFERSKNIIVIIRIHSFQPQTTIKMKKCVAERICGPSFSGQTYGALICGEINCKEKAPAKKEIPPRSNLISIPKKEMLLFETLCIWDNSFCK